jgi:hypothetical protein
MGSPFSDEKSVPAKQVATFGGVVTDFSRLALSRYVSCGVSAERLQRLQLDISSMLAALSGQSPVFELDKLAGKLIFSLYWSAGRFGRAAMQPLFDCHRDRHDPSPPQLDALRASLEFFASTLGQLQPRRFDFAKESLPPVLVWSDAAFEPGADTPASIGFVVLIPGVAGQPDKWLHSSVEIPAAVLASLTERKQYIGQLELLAAVAVYYSLPDVFAGRQVIHFIDNTSALAGLLKGYSSISDSARIVHAFWARVVGLQVDVWFEYVPSEANVADRPSRLDDVFVVGVLGSTRVTTIIPPFSSWLSATDALAFAPPTVPGPAAATVGQRPSRKRRASRQ